MSAPAFTRPSAEVGSPEWRAALFGQTGPICPYVLGSHLRSILGLPEEECGGEILDATVMLIRAGLFTINTVEPGTGAFWFSGDTKLTPTRLLTGYVYGEPGEPLDEEEDDWS
jgi:hypothetical protein